jgi:hypothetical protein
MRLAPPLATLPGRGLLILALTACAAAPAGKAPNREPSPPPVAEVVEEKPVFATAGWTRPAERRQGCVAGAVVTPADLRGQVEVTVKFAVGPDGAIDRFEDVSTPEAPPAVLAAVSKAVRGCTFSPGLDPGGAPAYVWVLLPLKVGTPARRPEPAAAPGAASKDVKVAPVEVNGDAAQPPPAQRKKRPRTLPTNPRP